MLKQMQVIPLDFNPVSSLIRLRQEWQDTGADLMTVKTPVALVLYDVCQALKLSQDDTARVLGDFYRDTIS